MVRGAIACGAAVWLTSSAAHAIDGIRPRTVALWPDDVACMTVVDRSVSPGGHLDYAIAMEDPADGMAITEDEVADGRRHQFLAFSDLDPRLAMPEWITWADVERAAEKGLVDPAAVASDWVLETHPALADTFVRIDADDARRPITFAAADGGVDWDTSAVPTGGWVVRAYTWDPWPNAWSDVRPGVIAIVDGSDRSTHPPALAVAIDDAIVPFGGSAELAVCLLAQPGTTLTASWAFAQDPEGDWAVFAEDVEPVDDAATIEFVPPADVVGGFVVLRVVATDPSDRTAIAYVTEIVTVLGDGTPPPCETDCDASSSGDIDATSEDDGGTSTTDAPSSTSTDTGADPPPAADAGDPPAGGCGCLQIPRRPTPWPLAIALFAVRRRRHARCAA